MANVLFKQGTQAQLDTIRTNKTAIEGAFYLTTDTHRLYIGRPTDVAGKNDAVPVNQGITFVSSISNLPTIAATGTNREDHAGEFYYVMEKNILCVYNGQEWVQINPNTDTKIEDVDVQVSIDSGVATVQTKVKYTTPQGATGGGSKSDAFKIKGAGTVKVSATNTGEGVIGNPQAEITITGDTYALSKTVDASANTATMTLKSSSQTGDANSGKVTLKGSTNTHISADGDNVKIDSDVYRIDNVGVTTTDGSNGFKINVQENRNGNATLKQATVSSSAFDPIIEVGDATANKQQIHFVGGTDNSAKASLPVYTKGEVDAKIASWGAAANAMTFKGIVESDTVLASKNATAQVGDTYKASNDFTMTQGTGGNVSVKKGDLIIATGTEGSNGYITSETLKYEVIPSGDETVYTYKGVAITGTDSAHGIQLDQYAGNQLTTSNVAALKLKQGTCITLSSTASNSNQNNTITIGHDNVTRTNTTDTEVNQSYNTKIEMTVVTGVTTNAQGHVTGVTTKKYNLTDTNGKVKATYVNISSTSATTGTGTSAVTTYTSTLTNHVWSTNSASTNTEKVSGSYDIQSTSLELTSSAASINTDSGATNTKAVLNINMVWGSF